MIVSMDDFEKLDIRKGTITDAEVFKEARKPSIKLWIDFGDEIGQKKSSAQLADRYSPEQLIGSEIIGVVNFPVRQIGPFLSEVLVLGLSDIYGSIVLVRPEFKVPNGCRLI